jgi:hypothetical protein
MTTAPSTPRTHADLRDVLTDLLRSGFDPDGLRRPVLIDTDTYGIYHQVHGHVATWWPKKRRGVTFWASPAECPSFP